MRQFGNHILPVVLVSVMALSASAYAEDGQTRSGGKPWSQADRYYGAGAMDESRQEVQASHGGSKQLFLMADRLETQFDDGEDVLLWDAQGWYGGDINKLWVKSEGDYSFEHNKIEEAELQALWSRAIAPYFDAQAGVRYDFEPDGLAYGVIGIQGLAPQWWELDAALFVSEEGDVTARIEAENDLLLTQRLILQPRVELGLAAQDVTEREIGSGVSSLDAGLRLRYEFVREFAPYVGVEWQKKFGDTADLVDAAGGNSDHTVFVAGVRLWF